MKIARRYDENLENHSEGLPNFISKNREYTKYFSLIANHKIVAMDDFCLFIFCRYPQPTVHIVEEVEFPFTDADYAHVCNDYNYPPIHVKNPAAPKAILFTGVVNSSGRRVTLGHFLIDRKTLLTCDITHVFTERTEKVMQKILNWLIERNYITKIDKAKQKKSTIRSVQNVKITVGSDPEFEYVDKKSKKIVPACKTTRFGCGGSSNTSGEWGTDGCGMPVEARPKPGKTPEEAVENMRRLFKKVNKYDLRTTGDTYTIGGHLHVGGITFEKGCDMQLLELYDNMIGVPTSKMNGGKRKPEECGYGALGSYERKSYGFEYRTPPAGVFYTPRFTQLCYKIMQNTAKNWYAGEELERSELAKENLKVWANFTDEEIEEYFDLIKNYKKERANNVVAAWCAVDCGSTEPVYVSVEFNENDSFSEEFIQVVSDVMNGVEGNIDVKIYGLARSRGKVVSGINLEGYEKITHPFGERMKDEEECDEPYRIGIAFELRVSDDEKVIENVAKAIKNEITAILKGEKCA